MNQEKYVRLDPVYSHLAIEEMQIEKLIPYARNARTHSDAQVAQIASSIREFGWTNPVLIDEKDGIIAGHGRVLAARKLEMVSVPCIRLRGLSEAKKRALIIADNQLALNAGWNRELLVTELQDLAADMTDLSILGFDERELKDLFAVTTGDDQTQSMMSPDLQFRIVVEVENEQQHGECLAYLEAGGYKCRPLIL